MSLMKPSLLPVSALAVALSLARGADAPLAYGEVMRGLKLTLEELRSHRPEVEKLNQLVDWLIERRRESGDG